jgi:hypothetical protein
MPMGRVRSGFDRADGAAADHLTGPDVREVRQYSADTARSGAEVRRHRRYALAARCVQAAVIEGPISSVIFVALPIGEKTVL